MDHWAAVDTVKRDCVHPMPLPPGLWSSLDLSKHSSRNSLTADAIRHGSRTKSSLQLVACVAPHYTSNHESIVRELIRRKFPSDAPFCGIGGIGGAEPRSCRAFAGDRSHRRCILETRLQYVRMKWSIEREDAADFTQDFFTRLLEKEFLDAYDLRKGSLHTFLCTCADRLFMNQARNSKRLKRRAGSPHLPLDFEEAEQELATISRCESPEDRFDKEWVRSLFALGVQRLRVSCENGGKMVHFRLFERCDPKTPIPRPPSQLADESGLLGTRHL